MDRPWVAMDRSWWLWIGVNGFEQEWVSMNRSGFLWIGVGGYG